MLVNGFKTSFQGGLGQADQDWMQIATVVPSATKEQKYGWMGKIPNVREWVGPRAVQNLQQHDYAIKEKPLELT
nr:Mu-like prophage major head subunit gpT family protein [Tabrizicola sp.]